MYKTVFPILYPNFDVGWASMLFLGFAGDQGARESRVAKTLMDATTKRVVFILLSRKHLTRSGEC